MFSWVKTHLFTAFRTDTYGLWRMDVTSLFDHLNDSFNRYHKLWTTPHPICIFLDNNRLSWHFKTNMLIVLSICGLWPWTLKDRSYVSTRLAYWLIRSMTHILNDYASDKHNLIYQFAVFTRQNGFKSCSQHVWPMCKDFEGSFLHYCLIAVLIHSIDITWFESRRI